VVDGLLGCGDGAGSKEALERGIRWLDERVEDGGFVDAPPIRFYFAKLRYIEELYPVIDTIGAPGRAIQLITTEGRVSARIMKSAVGPYG
jgi:hypothetical protein